MLPPRLLVATLSFLLTSLSLVSSSAAAGSASERVELLAGSSLAQWYTFLEKHGRGNDPEQNFQLKDGVLTIRGKDFGYLATLEEFENYELTVEFRWGERQWAPRETGKRDSGLLYHFPLGEPDLVWPKSIEFQVQEGDCGDIWFVNGAAAKFSGQSEFSWGMVHVFRTADHEKPRGEWNTLKLICDGDRFEHHVNGHLVASGWEANVRRGRMLLQSEGAEVFYRNLVVVKLPRPVKARTDG